MKSLRKLYRKCFILGTTWKAKKPKNKKQCQLECQDISDDQIFLDFISNDGKNMLKINLISLPVPRIHKEEVCWEDA